MTESIPESAMKLEVRHISKQFGKVVALDDVSLTFHQREIHTLLGENGAGKTTLMNIIYGLYHADQGDILLNGEKQDIKDPRDSLRLGIGMVPQFFKLVSDMSIVENVYIFLKNTKFMINKNQVTEKVKELAELFHFEIKDKLHIEIGHLSEGEKQKVEILKVLARESKIILFDEATNVLAPNELNAFLNVIRDLNKKGYTILYITHRLQEALEISDRISVFRKGELVGTMPGKEATYNKLTKMMVGAEFEQKFTTPGKKLGEPVLEVSSITVNDDRATPAVRNLSFELYRDEIVGLAGIEGNGSVELAEAIMGLRDLQCGSISYYSEDLSQLPPRERMRKGMTFMPGTHSLVPLFSVSQNSVLDYPEKRPFSKRGILNWGEINTHAEKIVHTYQVQTPDVFFPAGKLSGGNRQRLALGRKIEARPRLMIAYQPTKGLDINSQNFIYEKFSEMKQNGSTILFIGADLDELYQICNRLMVICRGEIVGVFDDVTEVSKIDIGVLMTGGQDSLKKDRDKDENF
jgi:simple sugar transport system ATP-binding protein